MKTKKSILKDIATIVVGEMIEADFYEWPPVCTGYFYQPKKPKAIFNEPVCKDNSCD